MQYFPAQQWLRDYRKAWLNGDISAGITVGVMLVPQGMAYSLLAGLPPVYGLYASILPLVVYALLGTSRQLAVGPVAMVSLLTATGVSSLAAVGSEQYLALAIALSLLVGIFQFGLGAFRLGFLVTFLSHPVISGFTSAAALIIGFSQLKHLLGLSIPNSHYVHKIVWDAVTHLSDTNWITLLLGLVGMGLILGSRRLHPSISGPLVAVVAGVWAVWGLGLADQGVKIVGVVPKGLPSLGLPQVDLGTFQTLLPTALAIALVGFMESFAVAKAIQIKHRDYELNANQELLALGAANLAGSVFQAFPVTGGFSRTAVNDQAGARTGLASIISALVVLLTLLFLTPLFYFLPNAILASIIMVAVAKLVDWREAVHLWHAHRTDFWMLMATFVFTLALGIELGIGIGVLLSLAAVIYGAARPHVAVLGKIPDAPYYLNVERHEQLISRPDVLVLRFDAPLFFANADYFRDTIEKLAAQKGDALRAIIVQCDTISEIDSSAMAMLERAIYDFRALGIKLILAAVIGPVRDRLAECGLRAKVGEDSFFLSVQQAVDALDGQQRYLSEEATRHYTLQANGAEQAM